MTEPKKASGGCCSPTDSASSCAPVDAKTSVSQGCCLPPEKSAAAQYCPPENTSECAPPKGTETPCCPPQEESACCPPSAAESCCPSGPLNDRPGYRLCRYVTGWMKTPAAEVPVVSTRLERQDRLGHWAMRWGMGRMHYQVTPGLYAVGAPDEESPVLVSANYKMSFDLLRRAMDGLNAWILVIDTQGINVWCAAGKGTFGTAEIVRRVRASRLEEVVSHRTLTLPQLGAPGVSAHEVKRGCGFTVEYGPVRVQDLPSYLEAGHRATEEMRRVSFGLLERFVLTPVELVGMLKKSLWVALALLLAGGIGPHIFGFGAAWERGGVAILVYLMALLCGAVLTPLLLPWIPGRAFSLKGALSGAVLALALLPLVADRLGTLNSLAALLLATAVSSYCAMNFTGSTTFTSPSGVEKEMRRYIPCQLAAVVIAALFWVGGAFLGGSA